MKNTLLIIAALFSMHWINAQEYETIIEEFNDNARGWTIDSSKYSRAIIENGHYKLSVLSSKKKFFHSLPIDHNYDYSIETKIKRTGNQNPEGFTIMWGLAASDDYLYWFFNNYDNNKMVRVKNGMEKPYHAWSKLPANSMNPRGSYNIIKINKRGNSIQLFVNSTEVATVPNIEYIGTYLGFDLSSNESLEIDYIKIKRRKQTLNLVANPVNGYVLENLGDSINSKYSDLSGILSSDGSVLYYTRRQDPTNLGGAKASDIFSSSFNTTANSWNKAERLKNSWNNDGNNFLISISPDGNTALLGNTYKEDGTYSGKGISISTKREGAWGIPVKQEIVDYENKNREVNFFLTNDGLHLIMAIEKTGGFGDLDLYVSELLEDGKWSTPKNLGKTVNTYSTEASPFLAADGRTLYFSSYTHEGYGSTDMFVTKRLDDSWTNWSVPENLGPEINSKEGDLYFYLPAKGDYAYMVSQLSDTRGLADIYKIKLSAAAQPDPVILFSGKTYNKKTGELINAEIVYEDLSTAKKLGKAYSTKEDGFKLTLSKGGNYGFRAEASGFIPISENIDLKDLDNFEKKEVNLYLVPIEKGQVVRLNNIFFDFNKSTLTAESNAELDRLVKIMNENANLKIEVGGHTDDKGTDDYNLKLSQARSESVMTYLLSKGIEETRLKAKGYGKAKPVVSNKTVEGQQVNRRVEFTIL